MPADGLFAEFSGGIPEDETTVFSEWVEGSPLGLSSIILKEYTITILTLEAFSHIFLGPVVLIKVLVKVLIMDALH